MENKIFNVKDFGAVADGVTMCTDAINETINKVARACNMTFDALFNRLDGDFPVRVNSQSELTDSEALFIEAYRNADAQTQEMIKRLLTYNTLLASNQPDQERE